MQDCDKWHNYFCYTSRVPSPLYDLNYIWHNKYKKKEEENDKKQINASSVDVKWWRKCCRKVLTDFLVKWLRTFAGMDTIIKYLNICVMTIKHDTSIIHVWKILIDQWPKYGYLNIPKCLEQVSNIYIIQKSTFLTEGLCFI